MHSRLSLFLQRTDLQERLAHRLRLETCAYCVICVKYGCMSPEPPIRRRPGRPAHRSRLPSHVVSATAAAKTFGALVDRVRESQTVYVIERGGVPVAEIAPVRATRCTLGELAALLASLAPAGEAFLKEVEAGIERLNRSMVPPDRWER